MAFRFGWDCISVGSEPAESAQKYSFGHGPAVATARSPVAEIQYWSWDRISVGAQTQFYLEDAEGACHAQTGQASY